MLTSEYISRLLIFKKEAKKRKINGWQLHQQWNCGCNILCVLLFLFSNSLSNSVSHNNTNFHFPVNNSNRLYRKETDSRIYKYNKCHHHAKWFLPYSCSRNVTSVRSKLEEKTRNCKSGHNGEHIHTRRSTFPIHNGC